MTQRDSPVPMGGQKQSPQQGWGSEQQSHFKRPLRAAHVGLLVAG